jgi:gliding motility-associated-like protein
VCLSAGSVQVINNTQSIQIFPDVITGYTINFGDGYASLTNTNAAWSPTYGYNYAFPPSQVFNVTMTGSNNLGCVGATSRTLQVNNPVPGLHPVNPADYFPCLKKGLTSTVNFTANPGYLTYTVNFGDPPGSSSSQTMTTFNNIPHVYSQPGTYIASLSVVDNGACRATETKTITVIGQATAAIQFAGGENRFCVNDVLIASSNTSLFVTPMTNTLWTFTGLQSNTNIVTQNLPNVGAYQISLNVSWNGYCPSSDTQMVYVSDPKAVMELDKKIFCLGDEIHVRVKDTSSVGVWQWAFGDNVPQVPVVVGTFSSNFVPNPFPYVYNIYPNNGQEGKTLVTLIYWGLGKTCRRQDTTSIFVVKLDSDFEQSDHLYKHCLGIPDTYTATFVNPYKLNLNFNWNFGGSIQSGGASAAHTFTQSGLVPVTLTLSNSDYGCKSVSVKNMTILPLPKAYIRIADTICPKDTFAIVGSGEAGFNSGIKGILAYNSNRDSVKFTPQNTFSLNSTATVTTTYSLSIVDDNGCKSLPAVDSIYVRAKPNIIRWDTTVIIGETIPINGYVDKNYTYTWTPLVQDLSCLNCYNPVSSTTVSLTYTLLAEDSPLACYVTAHTFTVNVNPKTSIDVPSAFTPNGDGINDVLFIGGWGIRKVNYFKIFNRWGQLLFQSNDVKVGWDGKFEGIPQNMETYVYEVSVETYLDSTLTKSGTVKIIR